MVARNRKFEGHSEWMDEFNKIHNPDYYYGKKTQKKKIYKTIRLLNSGMPLGPESWRILTDS